MSSRAVILLASTLLAVAGCDDASEGSCASERCEVWSCGDARPTCPCSDLCERPACASVTVYARDPEGGCTPFGSPCDVPTGWDYFLDESQCSGATETCVDRSDCAAAQSCDIRSCARDAVGTCVDQRSCDSQSGPVVGCDGREYESDCERLTAGARLMEVTVETTSCSDSGVWAQDPASGACSYFGSTCYVPPGWSYYLSQQECEGPDCPASEAWFWDESEGRCVSVSSGCEVPGGVEYFLSQESCDEAVLRCDSASPCSEGLVCDLSSCDAGDGAGRCVPLPLDCVGAESVPVGVCGCDGITYEDDCSRLLAGVGRASDGPCP